MPVHLLKRNTTHFLTKPIQVFRARFVFQVTPTRCPGSLPKVPHVLCFWVDQFKRVKSVNGFFLCHVLCIIKHWLTMKPLFGFCICLSVDFIRGGGGIFCKSHKLDIKCDISSVLETCCQVLGRSFEGFL